MGSPLFGAIEHFDSEKCMDILAYKIVENYQVPVFLSCPSALKDCIYSQLTELLRKHFESLQSIVEDLY